jgi:membrane associated rhomboid family serine protease
MAAGSRICPHCGRLNAIEDKECMRCGKQMPGQLRGSAKGMASELSGDGTIGTKLLVGLCLAVFGLCMLTDETTGGIPGLDGFKPWTTIRFGALLGLVIDEEPWRVVSAIFVHSSLLHVGLNMLGLVSFGRALEAHLGSARLIALFVLCGVLGFVATLLWRGDQAFSVGASGSIFGLLGATVGGLFVRRSPDWHRMLISNLILALALAFVARGIEHSAHIGGFVSGVLFGLLLEREPSPRRRDRAWAVLAVIMLLSSLVSIGLSIRSPVWKGAKQLQEAARHSLDSSRLV